jgi:hypothetical protein
VDLHDLAYALNQVVHNFGAVAVTAGAASARWWQAPDATRPRRRLAWLVFGGWAAQAASGATFGAISYITFGRLPDIHGIAVAALLLKMACAAAGLLLSALYLARGSVWEPAGRSRAWTALVVFSATALCAAAFLRWLS